MPDFSSYLESVRRHYEQWWKDHAFIDEIDDATWVEFPLSSTTQDKPKKLDEQPKKTPPQLVLDAVQDYAQEKMLIVGPPGAGKSTLLAKIAGLAAIRAIEDPKAAIPVLVELRDYKIEGDRSGLRGLILRNLESHDPSLDDGDLKKILQERRLLLLVDGLNEKPEARRDLIIFCRNISLIATGRQDGEAWEIERKLELQPLSEKQVRDFFELRLPNTDRKQLQTLGDRVRDFGQTPLMVWMLYSIFRANKDVPETRGEAYRSFTTLYAERAKDGIDLSDSRSLLGKLAFEMMRSKKIDDPTDFSLKIREVDATNVLGSEAALKRMLNHLLKPQGKAGNREISFCHQSLQEYYAAEYLLGQIKNLDNDGLQQEFLNYLKWTEPVALMLALVDDEALAVRVVEQALDVDLMLGARLAGEVRSGDRDKALDLLPNTPYWMKVEICPSHSCTTKLIENKPNNSLPKSIANERSCNPHAVILRLKGTPDRQSFRYDFDRLIQYDRKLALSTLQEVLNENNTDSHCYALDAVSRHKLKEFSHTLIALLEIDLLKNEGLTWKILRLLASFPSQEIEQTLLEILKNNKHSHIHINIIEILGEIKSQVSVPVLIAMLKSRQDDDFKNTALLVALSKIGVLEVIPTLEYHLRHEINIELISNQKSDLFVLGPDLEYEFSSCSIARSIEALDHRFIKIKVLTESISLIGGGSCLPILREALYTFSHTTNLNRKISGAIKAIQSKYQFYNYQLRRADRPSLEGGGGDPFAKIEDKLEAIDRRTQKMAEQPSTISISGGTFNGPVNLASNQGHQPTTIIDTQNNYFGTDEALLQQITDLQTFITELESQHPNLQTEAQANTIVQTQLDQLQTQNPDRWQKLRHQMGILKAQFFNPDRHAQAAKATIVEVTKAKWEESLIVKAIVTYLDKFSESPDKGA